MGAPDVEARVVAARVRKAAAIADVLDRAGGLGVDVSLIDDAGRRSAEALAGVRLSSDATWDMVATILSARAAVRARFGSDPFAGLS